MFGDNVNEVYINVCSVVMVISDKSFKCNIVLRVVMLSTARRCSKKDPSDEVTTLEVIRGERFPKLKLIADATRNVMADEGTAGGNSSFIP